jgi:hypothetical protein
VRRTAGTPASLDGALLRIQTSDGSGARTPSRPAATPTASASSPTVSAIPSASRSDPAAARSGWGTWASTSGRRSIASRSPASAT